jgi:hypothetical protein
MSPNESKNLLVAFEYSYHPDYLSGAAMVIIIEQGCFTKSNDAMFTVAPDNVLTSFRSEAMLIFKTAQTS